MSCAAVVEFIAQPHHKQKKQCHRVVAGEDLHGLQTAPTRRVKSASKGTALLVAGVELSLLLTAAAVFGVLRSSHPGPSGLLLSIAPLAVFPVLMILAPQVVGSAPRRSSEASSKADTLNLLAQPSRRRAVSSVALEPKPTETTTLQEKLEAIDWFQFEKLVELAIEKRGHRVTRRGGAKPDNGIDLLIHDHGQVKGVQCKHWKTRRVGKKDIREFLGAMSAERISKGIYITLGTYTQQASDFAVEQGIQLLDSDGLVEILKSVNANSDPEFLRLLNPQNKSCPVCESPMILRANSKSRQCAELFWGCSRYPRCRGTLKA
jgi:hypothetical protein